MRKTVKIPLITVTALFIAFILYTATIIGVEVYRVANAEPPKPAETVKLNADTIFALVNAERAKNGLKPLQRDTDFDNSAQSKADDMVKDGYYNHVDPVTGVHGYEYMGKDKCSWVGENLNNNALWASNEDVVSSWMASKGHHDAILDSRYETAGIAVNGTIVVQHFCQAN
jgi:uncharacterized protein YkwD